MELLHEEVVQFSVDLATCSSFGVQDLGLLDLLLGELVLQLLDDACLANRVVEEEGLNLLSEPVDVHVHVVELLDEVLQLYVLILLKTSYNPWSEMSLHLKLIRALVLLLLDLLFGLDGQFLLLFLLTIGLLEESK